MSNLGCEDLSDDSNDTLSVGYSFDLPQYNLRGLRIFWGPRRRGSVEKDDRIEWETCRNRDAHTQNREVDRNLPGRRFLESHDLVALLMGQAIDLALRMMETEKSVNIMSRVAKRLVDDCPEKIKHITPQSSPREVKTLTKRWLEKLRQLEFFKIQLIDLSGSPAAVCHRAWNRPTRNEPETLADYYPHNAGLLMIEPSLVKKLVYHATSPHVDSHIERQKCLFHLASLIIDETQCFWLAFLMPKMATPGMKQPVAVHSEATRGLLDIYAPNVGYHWKAEFFGGLVSFRHCISSPRANFNEIGGFGRNLSIGHVCLDRADGTEQQIVINSIIRCVQHGKHNRTRLPAGATTPGGD